MPLRALWLLVFSNLRSVHYYITLLIHYRQQETFTTDSSRYQKPVPFASPSSFKNYVLYLTAFRPPPKKKKNKKNVKGTKAIFYLVFFWGVWTFYITLILSRIDLLAVRVFLFISYLNRLLLQINYEEVII